jgi:hypothetical protein
LPPAVTPPSTASKRRKPRSSTVSSSSKKVRKISTSCVTCVICKELLVATHTLGCGHMFCGPCLAQWLEVQQQPSCPTCRAAVTGRCECIVGVCKCKAPHVQHRYLKQVTPVYQHRVCICCVYKGQCYLVLLAPSDC